MFPVAPGDEISEDGAAIVAPGQGRVLHFTETTDATDAPAREGTSEGPGFIIDGSEPYGGDLLADDLSMSEQLIEVGDGFDVDEAVEAGELELGVLFVDDSPGGGVFTLPLAGVIGMGSAHFVERSACGDGGGFLCGQGCAWFGEFLFSEFCGEKFGEPFGVGFASVLDIEHVRGEATLLIPGGDIGGGILGPTFDLVAGHRIAG